LVIIAPMGNTARLVSPELVATVLGLDALLQFSQQVGNAVCVLLACSQLLYLLEANVHFSSVVGRRHVVGWV
jgi:hypothetical protein